VDRRLESASMVTGIARPGYRQSRLLRLLLGMRPSVVLAPPFGILPLLWSIPPVWFFGVLRSMTKNDIPWLRDQSIIYN
jgi:hypothetical protein